MIMKNHKKLEGLVAAPFTPMNKKGDLNMEVIPQYYELLERNGVIGAFINGTTGEGLSLTMKERQLQALEWVRCRNAGGKVRIINMIGGTSYKECIENAIFSYEAGVDAVSLVAPYYSRPADVDHLAEFVALVGEAVPGLPLYFYHIPIFTGVSFPMAVFLEKISRMLPNFVGIKFTHEDLMDFSLCLAYDNGKFDILWGRDECMLSAFSVGCRGVIGSTYNYLAPLYHELIRKFDAGDLSGAKELQMISVKAIQLLGKYGGQPTGKAYMKYAGIECGICRSPVSNHTPEMRKSFEKDVQALGIGEYFSK